MAKIIEIKCLPEYFAAADVGLKPGELRRNDRDYAVGDMLIMREWKNGRYTGRKLVGIISYILRDFEGLADGWVCLTVKWWHLTGGGVKISCKK